MKPHEATLSVMQFDKERRCIVEDGQRVVAVLRNYDGSEWEYFLVAAPKMARALLDHVRYCEHCKGTGTVQVRGDAGVATEACPECADDRAVLTEAGVLP